MSILSDMDETVNMRLKSALTTRMFRPARGEYRGPHDSTNREVPDLSDRGNTRFTPIGIQKPYSVARQEYVPIDRL